MGRGDVELENVGRGGSLLRDSPGTPGSSILEMLHVEEAVARASTPPECLKLLLNN